MWTVQDAKARFSALVEDALAGRPQHVTRRGKPAVVVLAEQDYLALVRSAKSGGGSFVDHLLAIPQGDEAEFTRAQVRARDIDL